MWSQPLSVLCALYIYIFMPYAYSVGVGCVRSARPTAVPIRTIHSLSLHIYMCVRYR